MNLLCKRACVFLLSAAAAGCAAERIHDSGIAAFDRGEYEEAIGKLRQAAQRKPDNLSYRLDLRARHEEAVQKLIDAANDAHAAALPAVAEKNYRRVLVLEPGNERARRGLAQLEADRQHLERLARAAAALAAKQLDAADSEVRSILVEDPGDAAAVALAARIEQARGPAAIVPRLHTRDNRPVTLQFRDAPTKMVFEVLARQSGLNFIFDKDVKSDGKTTIFVTQMPVEQAIDLILAQNQLARQVLSEDMVLVYPSTPAKQKDYQDEIVHTFYLANALPKEAESMLKTVLGTKTMYTDDRSSVLIMRDTPEHVRMAERLVASLDEPESEVIMEVEVLEITHTLADQLGINYPSSVAFAPTPVSGGSGLVLADLHKQNSGSITVSSLSASIDLLKTVGDANVLSSPRIRAKNKEKAKILVGDRVPVITSGTSATTGGSYSTSSVQYLEVGLTLDVQPTIHSDGNVAIKVGLEVSSITKTLNIPIGNGGTTLAYQIGTRTANTVLELRDGETQVLAGLIQDSDTRSSSHIPGLGDLPVLGRLFGSNGTQRNKSEIVLSITPRIIRAQPRPSSANSEFWYGTESQTRSAPFVTPANSAATGAVASASATVPAVAASSGPVAPIGVGSVSFVSGTSAPPSAVNGPRSAPARIDSAVAPMASALAVATVPAAAAGGSGEPPAAADPVPETKAMRVPDAKPNSTSDSKPKATLEGPDTAKVGDEINVSVKLNSGQPLGRVRAQVRFDAAALQLISAEPGDLASSSDAKPVVRPGGVQIEFGGSADAPVMGGGSVVDMRFRVVATNKPALSIDTQVVLVGVDGVAVAATAATPLKIAVTQ